MSIQDLKTKTEIKDVKAKNSNNQFKHFLKQQTINQKIKDVKEKQNEQTIEQNYAVNQVENTFNQVNRSTIYRSKLYIKKELDKRSIKRKQQKLENHTNNPIDIKQSVSKNNLKTREFNSKITEYDKQITINQNDYPPNKISPIKMKNKSSPIITTKISPFYQTNMKSFVIKNHKNKIQYNTIIIFPFKFINDIINISNKPINIIKRGINTISSLYNYGISILILIIITLFIGVFGSLYDDGGINQEIIPLSNEVLAYEETITNYANQYNIKDYVPILEAIMMQESEGKGTDPMNVSECDLNTKYPKAPNSIQNQNYSIEIGVKYFSNCLNQTNIYNLNDINNLYLSLQGYNYGIKWANQYFDGYSKANAKVYSDNKKAELNTATFGDPYYVEHVMRYVNFNFRGTTNPNFNSYDAWVNKNPYAQAKLYGQCTWFAWGRFYELYGYSPGFTGNGWDCVDQLLQMHPNKFVRSTTPKAGAVFSGIGNNHVGIVISVNKNNLTIQEGNLDGITNTFKEAQTDWHTITLTLEELSKRNKGIIFANPK